MMGYYVFHFPTIFTKVKDTLTNDINNLHTFTKHYMKVRQGLVEWFCGEVCLAVILDTVVPKLTLLSHNSV